VLFTQLSSLLLLPKLKPVQFALAHLEEKLKLSSNEFQWNRYKTRIGLIRGLHHKQIIVTLPFYNSEKNECLIYNVQLKQIDQASYEVEGIKNKDS